MTPVRPSGRGSPAIPLLSRGDVLIRFAPHQPMPPGYTVQWWEQDEHHHWVLSENVYSDCERDRWTARSGAWDHYRRSVENAG